MQILLTHTKLQLSWLFAFTGFSPLEGSCSHRLDVVDAGDHGCHLGLVLLIVMQVILVYMFLLVSHLAEIVLLQLLQVRLIG